MGILESELHGATNDSKSAIEGHQRTANLLLVTEWRKQQSNDEDNSVRWDGSELCDGWVVAETSNNGRKAWKHKKEEM